LKDSITELPQAINEGKMKINTVIKTLTNPDTFWEETKTKNRKHEVVPF
jgi:hypothetical protein